MLLNVLQGVVVNSLLILKAICSQLNSSSNLTAIPSKSEPPGSFVIELTKCKFYESDVGQKSSDIKCESPQLKKINCQIFNLDYGE